MQGLYQTIFGRFVLTGLLMLVSMPSNGQFAPPAGQAGTTAIHADSNIFIGWAIACTIERGWVQIGTPELGKASFGTAHAALGKANLNVVSLGDGGMASLQFDYPLWDGPGADFAVFENSFNDTFLELAFVEVSSDGKHFVRFPSVSLTQTDEQVPGFGELDASLLYNLAGKYRGLYGTPFDLSELADSSGIDINHITHIRLIDVVGSIQTEYATYDVHGNIINDPWPTPFPGSGFDLDAVGVIHDSRNLSIADVTDKSIRIGPNPFFDHIRIETHSPGVKSHIEVFDSWGKLHLSRVFLGSEYYIDMTAYPTGMYLIRVRTAGHIHAKKIVKI